MRLIIVLFSLLFLFACDGKKKGVKFSPKEKVSIMTDQERSNAIAKKRSELSGLNIDTLLLANNIKLTILSPRPNEEISLNVSQMAQMRMLRIACQNGISGIGTDPIFVFAMTMTPINKGVISTVPEKKTATYDVNFYVGNVITKDIYASYASQIIGVGETFEQAAISAVSSIENTSDIQKMLKKASDRIIHWYDSNIETFKFQIESLIAAGKYAQAHALLSSVPQNAFHCFTYAKEMKSDVLRHLLIQRREENLIEMKNAISEAGTSYNAKVAAYYKMIPSGCTEKAEADKLYSKYMNSIQTAAQNEIEHQRYLEKSEIEYRTLQIQADIEASHAAIVQQQANSMTTAQESDSQSEGGGFFDNILENVINLASENLPALLSMLI